MIATAIQEVKALVSEASHERDATQAGIVSETALLAAEALAITNELSADAERADIVRLVRRATSSPDATEALTLAKSALTAANAFMTIENDF